MMWYDVKLVSGLRAVLTAISGSLAQKLNNCCAGGDIVRVEWAIGTDGGQGARPMSVGGPAHVHWGERVVSGGE